MVVSQLHKHNFICKQQQNAKARNLLNIVKYETTFPKHYLPPQSPVSLQPGTRGSADSKPLRLWVWHDASVTQKQPAATVTTHGGHSTLWRDRRGVESERGGQRRSVQEEQGKNTHQRGNLVTSEKQNYTHSYTLI